MEYKSLVTAVENYINRKSPSIDLASFSYSDDVVGRYLRGTAERLCHAFEHYWNMGTATNDVLIALRDFLLTFQTTMAIPDGLIEENNAFGIYKDETGKYYALLDVNSSFIKHTSFVEQAFPTVQSEPPKKNTKYDLHTNAFIYHLTGYRYFRTEEQKLCVYGALNAPKGYTTLLSMQTGGGKSLVTQTLAYAEKGLTIVVVPTVSLVLDQVRTSKKAIHSDSKDEEIFGYYSSAGNIPQIKASIEAGKARLLFISPEALIKNKQFTQMIDDANRNGYLRNLVIDEAHLVKAWGDAFRPDYLCLKPWRRNLMTYNEHLRTFLMSATFADASVAVLKGMFSDDGRWIEIRCDSLRKEPRFIYLNEKHQEQKKRAVFELVAKMPHPMILYVDKPSDARYWQKELEEKGYNNVQIFTGETRSAERKKLIDDWADNQFEIMIATSAFGVGVDKQDVRTVIHLMMPDSADAYYQELGRGGRDGLPCLSIMCLTQNEVDNHSLKLKLMTEDKIWGRWWTMYKEGIPLDDGSVIVNAETKPDYNKTSGIEEGNETDQNWNIYVLTLLDRYDYISIRDMQVANDGQYSFTIAVDNTQIASDTPLGRALIADLREKEWKISTRQFGLLRKAIKYQDQQCWSTMFEETYPLVSEYCAGCNYHEGVIQDEPGRFPLLQDVKCYQEKKILFRDKYFTTSREALFLYQHKDAMIRRIAQLQPDVIVLDSDQEPEEIYELAEDRPDLEIINFYELAQLLTKDDSYYVTGLMIAIYGTVHPEREYRRVMKWLHKDNGCVLHVSNYDFTCLGQEKKLSEAVEGERLREEEN